MLLDVGLQKGSSLTTRLAVSHGLQVLTTIGHALALLASQIRLAAMQLIVESCTFAGAVLQAVHGPEGAIQSLHLLKGGG